jgi:cell division septum initiation protein DivIVA
MRRLLTDIDQLQKEKADLEEEVRQLRAAIQLYTVVARKLAAEATNTRQFPVAA